MPVTQRYKPTAVFDPATAVAAWEAETGCADAKVSGHFGSDVAAEISTNLVHIVATSAAEIDSTTTIAAVADAVDLGAVAATTLDGAIDDDPETVTVVVDDAPIVTWLAAAIAAGGAPEVIVGTEAMLVTAADTLTLTVERASSDTTIASHLDEAALSLYVGKEGTVIPMDDPTVWGATGPADDYLVVICGTEQMKVDCDSIDGTNDFLVVTRGYDSTTAAVHADNAAITQYIDETTTQMDVASGAALVADASYKAGATGQEIFIVDTISTNRIVCVRGALSTTPAVIANSTALYEVFGEPEMDTVLAAVGGFEEFGDQSFSVSLPSS